MERIVDPNSVQSQFSALNRDRDALRNASNAAERERRREEEILQNLRATHADLTEKLRVAHAALGAENKKRQLLRDEEARLKKVMADERDDIVEFNGQLDGMEAEEKARKVNFVQEMDSLNDELDRALKHHEQKQLMKRITVQSVEILIKTRVQNEVKMEQERQQFQNSEEKSQETNSNGQSQKWQGLSEKMNEGLELLKEASLKLEHENEEWQRLEEERRALRAEMVKGGHAMDDMGEPLGEAELDELERLWEESFENEVEDIDKEKLGSSGKDETQWTNPHFHEGHQSNRQNHQQPINMELFYGNENDDDHAHHSTESSMMEHSTMYGTDIDGMDTTMIAQSSAMD